MNFIFYPDSARLKAMLRAEIKKNITTVIRNKLEGGKVPDFSVLVPENPEHGDYATNAALVLAKVLKKPPMEIAEELSNQLLVTGCRIEVAPPGFINLRMRDDFLVSQMSKVDENWGRSEVGKGKTVVVEYFQLNIGKPPHVGHLRSAFIGDSIARMFEKCGFKVITDTHQGDWGTQFGLLLWGFKQLPKADQERILSMLKTDPMSAFHKLVLLYIEANKTAVGYDENPGKIEFAKLEAGDRENLRIWKEMSEASKKSFLEQGIDILDLRPFDFYLGESEFMKDVPTVVKFVEENIPEERLKRDGKMIAVDLSKERLDEAVLIKSDGATTYLSRDLATIKYRQKEFNFFKNVYVVDVRQEHHFSQLFRVGELAGISGVAESKLVEFGIMKLPEGIISTRTVNSSISLKELVEEAIARAKKVIETKNPELKDKDRVAKMVGLGAIKYFDLSHHRKSDIVFRWEDALSFEGNTGPYLQYTHARLKSILKKADYKPDGLNSIPLEPLEHNILSTVMRFPEAIEDALKDYTPNTIANYLYALASITNEFYHSHPVLQEKDKEKKSFRLALVAKVAQTLYSGLDLLGIKAPDEM